MSDFEEKEVLKCIHKENLSSKSKKWLKIGIQNLKNPSKPVLESKLRICTHS